MRRISRHATAIGYTLALAILATNGVLVGLSWETIDRGNRQVERCREVILDLERVLSLLEDAESAERGYLLTGGEEELGRYRQVDSKVVPTFRAVGSSIAGDEFQGRVDELVRLAAEKIGEVARNVRLRQEGRGDEAVRLLSVDLKKDLMGRIRLIVAEVQTAKERGLRLLKNESRGWGLLILGMFLLTTSLVLISLASLAYAQRREASGLERSTLAILRQDALVEEQRRLAEFGRDVGLTLTESVDLTTMTRRCVEETVRHLDAAFARIWAVDEAGAVLELLASAGMYTHVDGPHARVPVGMYKIG
jgi:CHASE3 domain sensor protein